MVVGRRRGRMGTGTGGKKVAGVLVVLVRMAEDEGKRGFGRKGGRCGRVECRVDGWG